MVTKVQIKNIQGLEKSASLKFNKAKCKMTPTIYFLVKTNKDYTKNRLIKTSSFN